MINDLIQINDIFDENNKTDDNIIIDKIKKHSEKIINNYKNNKIFIGYIDNFEDINGSGIFIKDNILIEGNKKKDLFLNCNLNLIYKNNLDIIYSGNIENNNFKNGKLKYNDIKLNGHFNNGLPNEFCIYSSNNILYNGNWLNGKLNGYGIYKDNENSIKYEGEWLDNNFDGIGILHNSNNNIYNGEFSKGHKHGKGCLIIDKNKYYVEYNHNIETIKLNYEQKKILDLTKINQKLNDENLNQKSLIKTQELDILEYNNTIKSLSIENKKMEEMFLCKVCFRNIPNILLKPCNHLSICNVCEKTIRTTSNRCPICRKIYKDTLHIYLS